MISTPFFLIGVVFQLVIGGAIGSIILRASCSLFNRMFGSALAPPTQPSMPVATPVNQPAAPIKSDNPYAASATTTTPPPMDYQVGQAVPIPAFGKGFLICAGTIFVNVSIGIATGLLLGMAFRATPVSFMAIQAVSMMGGLLVFALINKVALPTTIGRSFALACIFAVIALLTSLAIGAVGVVISLLLGGI